MFCCCIPLWQIPILSIMLRNSYFANAHSPIAFRATSSLALKCWYVCRNTVLHNNGEHWSRDHAFCKLTNQIVIDILANNLFYTFQIDIRAFRALIAFAQGDKIISYIYQRRNHIRINVRKWKQNWCNAGDTSSITNTAVTVNITKPLHWNIHKIEKMVLITVKCLSTTIFSYQNAVYRNIGTHSAHTTVSWPNRKQW